MNSHRPFHFPTRGGLGYVSLDDIIDIYDFNPEIDDVEEIAKRSDFLDEMDHIAKTYLNSKERCIYYLVVHENKRTADITTILSYNGWRTTHNSIDRMFKILKLYYQFEHIDKEQLEESISANFNKLEKRVIQLLEERFTIQQINSKLGKKFHYTKTHCLIKSILAKLENLDDICNEYYQFLIEIRKFKDSCNFNQQIDKINEI